MNTYLTVQKELLLILICLSVSVYTAFSVNNMGYSYLFILPIIYLFSFLLIYKGRIKKNKPIFFLVLLWFGFLRYVALPFLIVLTESYSGRSHVEPLADSYELGIFLIAYELIVVTILILLFEKRKLTKNPESNNKKQFTLSGTFILSLLVISILLLIQSPGSLKLINFILPTSLSHDGFKASSTENLIALIFIVSKQLVFIYLLSKLANQFKKNKKIVFLFLSMILISINISIYMGTNRTDIIISFVASFLLFVSLFGKAGKKSGLALIVVVLFLITSVSSGRGHTSSSTSKLEETTDIIQVYTGGIYNVAIGVEVKDWFPQASTFETLFFDFVRPMIGVNLLVKDWDIKYSNIYFNERMWTHVERRSQILPMIAQGYLYFPFILAPLFTLFVIAFYYFLEKRFTRATSLEIKYFYSLILIRLGFVFGQNTMNIINDISMNLFLFIFIYYLGSLFSKKSFKKL